MFQTSPSGGARSYYELALTSIDFSLKRHRSDITPGKEGCTYPPSDASNFAIGREACSVPRPITKCLNVRFQNNLESDIQIYFKRDPAFNVQNDVLRFTA